MAKPFHVEGKSGWWIRYTDEFGKRRKKPFGSTPRRSSGYSRNILGDLGQLHSLRKIWSRQRRRRITHGPAVPRRALPEPWVDEAPRPGLALA